MTWGTMTDNEAVELYRRWLDELWAGDLTVVDSIVTEDFVGHWPDRDIDGPRQLAQVVGQTHAMLADLSFALQVGPIVAEDLVAARWEGHGLHADGTEATFVGNDIVRVRGGRIAEYWAGSSVAG